MTQVKIRYEGVQALRFVAALLVVVTHSTLYASERLDSSMRVWHFGEVGVDVFFTISGFVMILSTGSLPERDGWKYFGMRRLVRIVPMYWVATTLKIAMLIAIPGAALHSALQPGNIALSYFFLPSWNSEGKLEPVLGVGWTLIFEMFFYAVFTLALLLRLKPLWFCSAVLTLCALGSMLLPSGDDYPAALFYLSPIVMYFVVGMFIGRWARDRNNRALVSSLFAIFATWATIYFAGSDADYGSAVNALVRNAAVTALLLAVVAFERQLRWLPRSVVFMGDASYTLYLFHPLVAPIVPVALGYLGIRVAGVSVVGSVIAAIVAAVIIYRFVERPLTAILLARLPYVRPHPAGTVQVSTPGPAERDSTVP